MEYTKEQIQMMITELTPKAVECLRHMLYNPGTPDAVRAQLVEMILDRTLGKAEVPIKVTSVRETMENSQAKLSAMIWEIRNEVSATMKALPDETDGIVLEDVIGEAGNKEILAEDQGT